MILFPAIDLFEGKAVRLYKGDYSQMTVYSEHPEEIARDFAACGATHIHLVDLEGARSGETPNLETVIRIRESSASPSFIRICSSRAALPLFSGRSGTSISSYFPKRLSRFRYSSAISR